MAIKNLATASLESGNLPYFCSKGLRNGVEIIRDVITYFSSDTNPRNRKEDAAVLRTAEFGLQTLRDSCEIAEEERGKEALKDLREIINVVGTYSIKTSHFRYSFSRVVIPSVVN